MKSAVICFLATILALAITPVIEAQSPEMPEPLAIVVDADGKPMVQVISILPEEIHVLFEFDGVPARFELRVGTGRLMGCCSTVFFSEADCTGNVYIQKWTANLALSEMYQQSTAIVGPDTTEGTYRVFRSTGTTVSPVSYESRLEHTADLSYCNVFSGNQNLAPAEEILPNPLDGFHGPTDSAPDRVLTVKGGTRLP